MSGRLFPTVMEPPSPWSFDSALKLSWHLWVCHLACRLRIKVSWIWLVIWDPFVFNWFMLCPWPCHSFKSCGLPPTPYCFMLFFWAPSYPQCCLYNFLEGQPENSWPLGGKCYIISNPSRHSGLHLPCFLQHVQLKHLSVNMLMQLTGTQCLLEIHLLVHPFKGSWASKDNVCQLGS